MIASPICVPVGAVTVMEVGGTHVTAAAVSVTNDDFSIVGRRDLPLDSSASRDAILSTLALSIDATWCSAAAQCVVAMPGPFDYVRGYGSFYGIGKFQALSGLDLRTALAELLQFSPRDVSFVNDAVAYGIGEWAFGAGERTDRMLCLTLGTGVGSAFLDAGSAVTEGDRIPVRGEAHTICFDGAPLEETVSTAAIRHAYAAATGAKVSVMEVFARARAGDSVAGNVVTATMVSLGQALGPWVLRFGATTTVVGGAMSRSWDLVEPPLREGLSMIGATTALRAATLLDDAPLVGAAVWGARS